MARQKATWGSFGPASSSFILQSQAGRGRCGRADLRRRAASYRRLDTFLIVVGADRTMVSARSALGSRGRLRDLAIARSRESARCDRLTDGLLLNAKYAPTARAECRTMPQFPSPRVLVGCAIAGAIRGGVGTNPNSDSNDAEGAPATRASRLRALPRPQGAVRRRARPTTACDRSWYAHGARQSRRGQVSTALFAGCLCSLPYAMVCYPRR